VVLSSRSVRRAIVVVSFLAVGCGASVGSNSAGVGMEQGVATSPGGSCSERPAVSSCSDGYELCNVTSELDGCAYRDCVPAGQCTGG